MATGWLGISADDYYSMTPRELQLMCDGYLERYRETIEMQATAVQVGMVNANSKRKHKVFKRKTVTGKTGAVTREEKEEILSDLKSRLVR